MITFESYRKTFGKPRYSDLSQFPKKTLHTIWGDYPVCLLEPEHAWEFHHLLGRRRNDSMYSSVYNAAPLCRKAHQRGDLTTPEMQRKLFEKVSRIVSESILDGHYLPTEKQKEIDAKFLQFIQDKLYA